MLQILAEFFLGGAGGVPPVVGEVVHVTSVPGGDGWTTGGTIVIPTVEVGDFLLLPLTNKGANAVPTVVDDDVTGNVWARIEGFSGTTGSSVWYKRATAATSGKTITVSGMTTGSAGGLSVYRDVADEPNSFENVVVDVQVSGEETMPSFTPTRDNSMICIVIATKAANINTNTYTSTDPAVLNERYERQNTAQPCSSAHASAVQTTAGPTGAINWVQVNAAHITTTFNLLAAETPGVPPDEPGDGGIVLWRRRRRHRRR